MKIHCDVCNTAAASLMCCADEAVLCSQCDVRVHEANKLASKHERVPLLSPSPDEAGTRCDICQEKTGYFFCLEDRALLCRLCDVSIHSTNSLASNHKRYLVTGIRVGLHALLGQKNAEVAQVSSQRQVSTQSGSVRGSSVFNVAHQSSTPVSQPAAASLGFMSTVQHPQRPSSSMQVVRSIDRSASTSRKSSYGSVVPAKVSDDSPRESASVPEICIPSGRSSVVGQIRCDTLISSNDSNCQDLMKENSITESFPENISDWKAEEVLNFKETPRLDSTKKDMISFESAGWNLDFGDIDVNLFGESLAEVPSLPCSPGWKGKRSADPTVCFGYDNYLAVPESASPVPPLSKRRAAFLEV